MRTVRLSVGYKEAADKLVGRFPDDSNAPLIIDWDATVIADGEIRAVFLHNVIPPGLHKLAFQFWKDVDESLTNRIAAVGTRSLHRSVGRDGRLNPRRGVNKHVESVLKGENAAQGVLGWDPKTGGPTKLSLECPAMLSGNRPLIELVDRLYAKYVPSDYAIQRAAVERNPPSRLWLTAFSNVYILKQWATAYHKDDNNLPGVLTAITPFGTFSGGDLILPRWQIRIPYQPGDLVLFDPQQVHGVLPFKGERLSAAFYAGRHVADELGHHFNLLRKNRSLCG